MLGQFDLIIGRQHAIKNFSDLSIKLSGFRIFNQELFDRVVNADHPRTEPLEIRLQLNAWRFAAEHVALKRFSRTLVISTFFLEIHIEILLNLLNSIALDAVPRHQLADIIDDLLLTNSEVLFGH